MHARVVKAAGGRLALDDELDLEARQQNFVEHPDDEFVLADGKTPHRVRLYSRRSPVSCPQSISSGGRRAA
jgi:hypothetical protein